MTDTDMRAIEILVEADVSLSPTEGKRLLSALRAALAREAELQKRIGEDDAAHQWARAEAAEAREAAAREALRKITNIPLGPDTGSAQWQIGCAVKIAEEALAIRPAVEVGQQGDPRNPSTESGEQKPHG